MVLLVFGHILREGAVFTAAGGTQPRRGLTPELGMRQPGSSGDLLDEAIEHIGHTGRAAGDEAGVLVGIEHQAPIDRAAHLADLQPAADGLLVAGRDHPAKAWDLVDELVEILQQ